MSAVGTPVAGHKPHLFVPTDHFLNLRGTTLHYLEWGDVANPPLILLHGSSAHAHWWDHIATILACDFHVFVLDLRGHGDSNWVSNPPAYEIEDYVADLVEFVSLLSLSSFGLIGHSLGGFIAMSYASIHHQQLCALVVVDMGFRIGGNRFMRLLRRMPSPVYIDEDDVHARFRLLPEETHVSSDLFRHVARHSVRRQEDGSFMLKFDRATLGREPRDLRAQLPNIYCPTLLLRGSESHNLSAETLTKMVHLCPQARGVEIAGAGHHIFLDTPEEFLVEVRSFLLET
jgi:pimeloyl-ACP methyl ester carboxylesterase